MKPMQIVKPDRDMRRKQYVFDKQLNIFNVPAISRSEAHVLAKWYDENEANAERTYFLDISNLGFNELFSCTCPNN